jgi:hypothetical protein
LIASSFCSANCYQHVRKDPPGVRALPAFSCCLWRSDSYHSAHAAPPRFVKSTTFFFALELALLVDQLVRLVIDVSAPLNPLVSTRVRSPLNHGTTPEIKSHTVSSGHTNLRKGAITAKWMTIDDVEAWL